MAPQKDTDALKALDSLVQTASALLKRLQSVLAEIQESPASNNSSPDATINALALAHDSASLVRAHGTKISLLIINEPFTPSAVSTVLRELIAGPIPGLLSSAQACTPRQYTEVVCRELARKARRVLSELHELVQKIPRDGKVLSGSRRGGFAAGEKGSLPATGLLWSACDEVIALSRLGVGGIVAEKIQQWRDVLGDIMDELKEWGAEEPDEDEEDEDEEDGVNHLSDPDPDPDLQLNTASSLSTAQAMLDQIMDSQHTIPRSDPDRIRPRLETCLQRLRLTILLYQALTKRRLKKLPPLPQEPGSGSDIPPRLDEMANALGALPDMFGDLACAFYELQPEEIDKVMDQCFLDAFAASDLFVRDWDGETDAFSDWVVKFQAEVNKTRSGVADAKRDT
ncbi:hypothetical protein EsDP_00005070 [Epichloe bromicola]|uniref:Cyclin-D1-binding protein 1-like N-terminal domain-containing protein n=1 Tax=Epichloe bromicola TaxID=79588 RepID=A0ABQ0CTK2_9HYPO